MGNPLFEHYNNRKKQEDARKSFYKTRLGKALLSATAPSVRQLGTFARGIRSLATDKEKYGQFSNMLRNIVFGQVVRALGPFGDLVQALIRPSGKAITKSINRELLAASRLLEAFGYQVSGPGAPSSQGGGSISDVGQQPVPQPTTKKPKPAGPMPGPVVGGTGGGRGGTRSPGGLNDGSIPPDDPLRTGEMLPVSSSNVHSIGYDWVPENPHTGTLKVRFLMPTPSGENRSKPGPLYYYINVPPEVFQAFRAAASKGKFVWDKLRIRGTVSGHQYYYYLAAIRSGYVPRQARRIKGEEWFVRRNVRGEDGNVYQSRQNDERVGMVGGGINGRPDSPQRGSPNRGQPDRGRPNRGRYPGPNDHAAMN